jgi:probable addiction module antidote protein
MKNTRDWNEFFIEKLKNDDELLDMYIRDNIRILREEGNIDLFLVALRNIVNAKGGMTKIANKTHLKRQTLYASLREKGNPRLKNFGKILHAIGLQIDVKPVKKYKYI